MYSKSKRIITMKIKMFMMGLAMALLLASCNKEVKPFIGDYSYKISGEVCMISPKTLGESGYDTTYQVVNKRGQMVVMKDERQGGNHLIVTLNEMNGGASTLSAVAKGDSIILDPYQFSSTFDLTSMISSNVQTAVYQIDATGRGVANGDMLLMQQSWNGHKTSDANATISGEKMTFIAERN